jgi:hypothetical protein
MRDAHPQNAQPHFQVEHISNPQTPCGYGAERAAGKAPTTALSLIYHAHDLIWPIVNPNPCADLPPMG